MILNESLKVGTSADVIDVNAADLLESSSVFHTDLDRALFQKLPLETPSSTLSSLVTLSSQRHNALWAGVLKPTGSITASYVNFGTSTGSFDIAYGGLKGGHFPEIDGLNTGCFLDPAEFSVFHAKGNEQNVFDRIDRQFLRRTRAT